MRLILSSIVVLLLGVTSAPPRADVFFDFEEDVGMIVTDKLDADGAQNGTIFNNVEVQGEQVPFGASAARFSPPDPPAESRLFSTIQLQGSSELGSAFTVAAHVDYDNTGFTRLFSSFRGTGPVATDRMLIDFDPSGGVIPGIRAIVNNTVVQTASPPAGITDPGYHHIALTYDDGDVAIYFDGSEVAAGNVGSGPVSMSADLEFGEDPHDGGGSANEQFRGNVDEVLVLGRVLNAAAIANLAENGVAFTPGGAEPAIFYNFEPPDSGGTITNQFGDPANDGIAHNNVAVDPNSANAAFGTQSAVLGDPEPERLFSSILIPGSADLGRSFTLAAEVSFENDSFTRLFSNYGGSGPVGTERMLIDFDPSGGVIPGIRAILNNTVVQTASPPAGITDPGYHHVAVTFDGGDVAIYFDGSEVAMGNVGAGAISMARDLEFGEDPHDLGGSANEQFRGNVDELLVLGRALDAATIAEIAEDGVSSAIPDNQALSIYYDFEGDMGDRLVNDGAQDAVFLNNVALDPNSANAARGVGSAILDDVAPDVPFSVIDVGPIGNLGDSFTLAAVVNVPGGGFAGGGLTRLFSTFAGTGSPAGRLIFDFDPNASVESIGIRVILPDGTALTHSSGFSVNEDHHLAATYNMGDLTIYLDGEPVETTTGGGGAIDLGEFPLRIGEDLGGIVNENLVGIIDDVLILQDALSPTEIRNAATFGFGNEPPPAVPAVAGDCSGDGSRGIEDVVCYVKNLFPGFLLLGSQNGALPCAGEIGSDGNAAILDVSGDGEVNTGDAVHLAMFLFGDGSAPSQGAGCFDVLEELNCAANPGCR